MKEVQLSAKYIKSNFYSKAICIVILWNQATDIFATPVAFGPYKVNFEYMPSYYRYEEKIYNDESGTNDLFMTLTSAPVVHSLTMDVRRYLTNNWHAQSILNLVIGSVNYVSDGSGYANGEQNVIVFFENNINYCKDNIFCTGAGYALRYLDNDSSLTVTSSGNTGYERENFLHLIPIGVSYRHALYHHQFSSLNMSAKAYLLIDGWQISHISRFGCDNDMKNKQNTGYGLESTVRLYASDKKWFYGAKLQYWKLDASEVVSVPCFGEDQVGSEPENTTVMAGLMVGYHYI